MIEQTVSIERMEDAIDIFGSFDENIRLIEQELGVRVVSRDLSARNTIAASSSLVSSRPWCCEIIWLISG